MQGSVLPCALSWFLAFRMGWEGVGSGLDCERPVYCTHVEVLEFLFADTGTGLLAPAHYTWALASRHRPITPGHWPFGTGPLLALTCIAIGNATTCLHLR